MALIGYSGPRGKLICKKNQKQNTSSEFKSSLKTVIQTTRKIRGDFFEKLTDLFFYLSLGEDILDPRSDSEMIAESRTIHNLNSTKMERSVFVIERHGNDSI
jgi:hypothetical protein